MEHTYGRARGRTWSRSRSLPGRVSLDRFLRMEHGPGWKTGRGWAHVADIGWTWLAPPRSDWREQQGEVPHAWPRFETWRVPRRDQGGRAHERSSPGVERSGEADGSAARCGRRDGTVETRVVLEFARRMARGRRGWKRVRLPAYIAPWREAKTARAFHDAVGVEDGGSSFWRHALLKGRIVAEAAGSWPRSPKLRRLWATSPTWTCDARESQSGPPPGSTEL